jgi:hypothetical protein
MVLRLRPLLLLILIAAVPFGTIAAEEAAKPAAAHDETAHVDAAPNPEWAKVQRMLRRDTSPERFKLLSNGMTKLEHKGGFQSVLIVRINPEGEPIMSCVTHEAAAKAALGREMKPKVREP